MKLRNRAIDLPKVTPTLAPANEDPEHELYVPEEYREHYLEALPQARKAVTDSGEAAIRSVASHIADQEIDEQMPLPVAPPTPSLFARLDRHQGERNQADREVHTRIAAERNAYREQRTAQLIDADYDRLRSLAVHWEAQRIAQYAHTTAVKSDQDRSRNVRQQTCPICGHYAHSVKDGGPVESRPLFAPYDKMWTRKPDEMLRSCSFCYDEALDQLRAARRQAAAIADPARLLTRDGAVRAALVRLANPDDEQHGRQRAG